MKKKVGIILDSLLVSKQMYDLINLSSSSINYEITTLIINEIEKNKMSRIKKIVRSITKHGVTKFISNTLFLGICAVEKFFVKRNNKFSNFYKKYKILNEKFKIINVKPIVSKSGFVYRYKNSDIELIKKENLDLLIRGGSGILKGEILTSCPNGIISFHHADNNTNRGGPPGFWEVYKKNPRTGFIIQKLNEELDGGDVLYKGFIATRWFYNFNLANLFEVSNPFLHHVLNDITSKSPKLKVKNKIPYSFTLKTSPNLYQIIIYLIKISIELIKKIYNKITHQKYRWYVAYQHVNDWRNVVLWRSKKIPNPKDRFLADPFVLKRDGVHYCFVEDYNFKTNKGCISAYKIFKNACESLGVVLEEKFHLSYPFIFEYKNNLYMCPDTHEKNEIRIYKCSKFPHSWVFHKTIMKNVSAVDTIIFYQNNKWWLFTNIDQSIVGDHNCQLYIFHSTDPLSENWVPHELNPVIFDSLTARNGGFIKEDNNIYRVFQQQGFDRYGKGMGIAKIKLLTPDKYKEKILSIIEAKYFNNIKGTHTYNYDNGLLVLDFSKITKTD